MQKCAKYPVLYNHLMSGNKLLLVSLDQTKKNSILNPDIR